MIELFGLIKPVVALVTLLEKMVLYMCFNVGASTIVLSVNVPLKAFRLVYSNP